MGIYFIRTYSKSIYPMTRYPIGARFYEYQIHRDCLHRGFYSMGLYSIRDPISPCVFYGDPFDRASLLWRSILPGPIL